jgi:hypothetical protein
MSLKQYIEGKYPFHNGDHSTLIELYCEIIDDVLTNRLEEEGVDIDFKKPKRQRMIYNSFTHDKGLIDVCEDFIYDLITYQNCRLRVNGDYTYIIQHILNK